MRKYILIVALCLLSVFLVSCATFEKVAMKLGMTTSVDPDKKEQEEWEHGRLVRMGDEFVAWFNPEKNLIGSNDMEQYFRKHDIEPVEDKVLK